MHNLGISLLSCIEAEIQVLPVQCRQLNFSLSASRWSLPDSAIDLPDPKSMQIAVETSLLSCIESEIQVLPVWRRHLEYLTSGSNTMHNQYRHCVTRL
jgi:hypothetical protein